MTRPVVAVLLPVFNDWESLNQVSDELSATYGADYELHLCVVNDGSTIENGAGFARKEFASIEIVHLGTNLGHQRAICAGLVRLASQVDLDAVVVMDSDGEDSVASLSELLKPVLTSQAEVVVAQRASRSEGIGFKFFYTVYRTAFFFLTGENLNFGNFSALSMDAVRRLVYAPELWNHYPGTLMKSHMALFKVPIAREQRYHGQSKMSLASLTTHGLAGLSVFVDRIFARLLLFTAAVASLLLVAVGVGVASRLVLQVPIAGWLALLTTAAFIVLLQLLGTLMVLAFVSLSMRSRYSPPPVQFVNAFIQDGRSSRSSGVTS